MQTKLFGLLKISNTGKPSISKKVQSVQIQSSCWIKCPLQSVVSGPREMWPKGWTALLALTTTLVTANSSDDMEELTKMLSKLKGEVMVSRKLFIKFKF